jgi:hypothetical protein
MGIGPHLIGDSVNGAAVLPVIGDVDGAHNSGVVGIVPTGSMPVSRIANRSIRNLVSARGHCIDLAAQYDQ